VFGPLFIVVTASVQLDRVVIRAVVDVDVQREIADALLTEQAIAGVAGQLG
jgi:hypothetical protein